MKREEVRKKKHKIVKKHKHSRKKNVKHLQWQFKKNEEKTIIKNNKLKLNNIYTYDERCRLMFLFDIDVCM